MRIILRQMGNFINILMLSVASIYPLKWVGVTGEAPEAQGESFPFLFSQVYNRIYV